MSQRAEARRLHQARLFAALGDGTRLHLLLKLCRGRRLSITELTSDSKLTRQAVTKHLRVLEEANLVSAHQKGRHRLFEFTPEPIESLNQYLDGISAQWDRALGRLKALVELA